MADMNDLIEERPVEYQELEPPALHTPVPSSEPLPTPRGQSACDLTEAIQAKIRERVAMGWKAINAHIRAAPVYACWKRIVRAYACTLRPMHRPEVCLGRQMWVNGQVFTYQVKKVKSSPA